MEFDATRLLHHLLRRGLLGAGSIVDGDLVIVDASRRNRNFKVVRQSGAGLFCQQSRDAPLAPAAAAAPAAAEGPWSEAACHQLARSGDVRFAALATVLPRYRDYDHASGTLVTELVQGAEDLG